jgi:CheY-like chemotaxis protein
LTAKHVTPQELSFLQGNHVMQLILKGSVNREQLLQAILRLVKPAAASSTVPRRERKPVRQPPLLLMIEDNPDNQTALQALLSDSCQLLQAKDSQAGLALAQEHLPDLILLDISLPVMNGIETLQALRADERLRHVPVIALTAHAMQGDPDKFLAMVFDAYIPKPIEHDLLLTTIEKIFHA